MYLARWHVGRAQQFCSWKVVDQDGMWLSARSTPTDHGRAFAGSLWLPSHHGNRVIIYLLVEVVSVIWAPL